MFAPATVVAAPAPFPAAHYITRAELAGLLTRALELPAALAPVPTYPDIPDQSTRELAARVQQAGLMAGFPGGDFRPQDKVTRAQAVVVLFKAAQRLPETPRPALAEHQGRRLPFRDIPQAHWAYAAISWSWQQGLVSGVSQNSFSPDRPVTAWEFAQLMLRFLGPEATERADLHGLLARPAPALSNAKAIPVLLYHHLAPAGSGFENNRATITPEEFAWQMEHLATQGYKVLTRDELVAFLEGKITLPERSVAITFDDGYASNLKYAFPILKKHGFHAFIHVITDHLPQESPLPYDVRRLQRLSGPEIKELADTGLITIGSHTDSLHTYVPSGRSGVQRPALVARLKDPQTGEVETEVAYRRRILADLALSRAKLEEVLGSKVTVLAYPYGVSDPLSRKLTAESGFTLTFGTLATLARRGSGLSQVPRLVVLPGLTQEEFARLLQGE
ncbi:MAG: polysaccharide deacetylase family protein [bacterium]